MGIKRRIRRLERSSASCPECRIKPQTIRVVYPEDNYPPECEFCLRCGRALEVVIKVEYEGEGVIPIG